MKLKLFIFIALVSFGFTACYAQDKTEPKLTRANVNQVPEETGSKPVQKPQSEMKRMSTISSDSSKVSGTDNNQAKSTPSFSRISVRKVTEPETK